MTHYFTLRALSAELDASLRGHRISGTFTQTKDELMIGFDDGMTLCVSVHPKLNYCFLKPDTTRAKRNTVDLFPAAVGTDIAMVKTLQYDRTIVIGLHNDLQICCRLYGTAAGNIILTDATSTIVDAFKNKHELLTTKLSAGRIFDDAVLTDIQRFAQALIEAGGGTAASLKHAVPFLGSLYATEVLHRSGIASTAEITAAECENLFTSLHAVIGALNTPSPRIYDDGTFSVIPLSHLGNMLFREFPSVNDAVRVRVSSTARGRAIDSHKRVLSQKLAGELDRIRRSLRAVENELQEASRAESYEHQGKLIMAQLDAVRKGMKQVDLDDLFGDGASVRINLDPALGPVQNAERYFAKARRARASRTESEERKRTLRESERLLALLGDECEASETADELEEFQERHSKELRKLKIAAPGAKTEELPFRVFTVSGEYEVWVGKSSSNNDLLTMKYAKPYDLWFHARGASGSHAVLKAKDKSEKIPKEAVRDAAAIAAYYSKMRNARTVPVAYCERKYVRKPKGAPPGTVTLEREEVLFVDPRLPVQEP